MVPTQPFSKSITPATWVGLLTAIFSPCLGSLVISLSEKVARAAPATRRTGPISVASAVR